MAAGLPVIASDFGHWREVVEPAGCGLLVNPTDTRAIARAIEHLIGHPEEAAAMGRRGREAAIARYNWPQERQKLTAGRSEERRVGKECVIRVDLGGRRIIKKKKKQQKKHPIITSV